MANTNKITVIFSMVLAFQINAQVITGGWEIDPPDEFDKRITVGPSDQVPYTDKEITELKKLSERVYSTLSELKGMDVYCSKEHNRSSLFANQFTFIKIYDSLATAYTWASLEEARSNPIDPNSELHKYMECEDCVDSSFSAYLKCLTSKKSLNKDINKHIVNNSQLHFLLSNLSHYEEHNYKKFEVRDMQEFYGKVFSKTEEE